VKNKAVLPLIILVTLASFWLVSCSGTPPPAEQPKEEAQKGADASTQKEEAPPATDKVTLTIWDFGGVDFEWMDKIVFPAYQEKHPNIEFNHVGVPEEELGVKLETAIAAGDVPDLAVFVPSRLAKAGHILALNDLMERDGLKVDDFCSLFKSRDMLEDKVYSMPLDANIWAMVYNKKLFQEAGLPELKPDTVITFDEWHEYAAAINKPADTLEQRVWGSAHFVPIWNSMNNYMSNPFVLGEDGRSCKANAETDDWIHSWEVMLNAHKQGFTPESTATLVGEMGTEDLFQQGKLGMMYGTLGNARAMRAAGLEVGLTGQPVVTPDWQGNVGGWTTSYSIMAGSKHPEEAWEFLKFMATEVSLLVTEEGGGEVGGLPCYLPLAEKFLEANQGDSLVKDSIVLLNRIQPPPFTVDIWTSVDPFNEAWRRMTEDGEDVKIAVQEAAAECQTITDDLWAEWDTLSQ
jgi:multiple sugar transport system substrate-binding protein